jgi:hypothetical protein
MPREADIRWQADKPWQRDCQCLLGSTMAVQRKGRLRYPAGLFPVVESNCDYWMGVTVAETVKGSVGAAAPAAATFCQIAPAWLLANARLPVEEGLVGIAVV